MKTYKNNTIICLVKDLLTKILEWKWYNVPTGLFLPAEQ